MFKNLEAEMVRNNISRQDIANLLNLSYNTIGCKMSGKNKFLYDEAIRIRNAFFPDLSVEFIFEKEITY